MAKSKLTTCSACGHEIAKGKKVICPNCGKVNKKPIYKRTWFIVVAVLFTLSALGSALGGGDDTKEATPTGSGSAEVAEKEPAAEVVDNETAGQKNAVKQAENYLRTMAFSRQGLIDQLIFEQYSNEDATYAVDKLNIDWKEQAVLKAENYLRNMAFSKTGLTKQLEFEGFTTEEANYGTENIIVDWKEQAYLKAKEYLKNMAFSRQGLIDQLEFEGFTNEQAVFGVDAAGL